MKLNLVKVQSRLTEAITALDRGDIGQARHLLELVAEAIATARLLEDIEDSEEDSH